MTIQHVHTEKDDDKGPVYFFSKIWWGLFLGSSILISLILLLIITFPLGFSVSSDMVFGVLALASGCIADLIFRKLVKRQMMISEKIPYSILYVWIPLCFFIIIFQPLD